jgi:serine phosphatase RsbU (regulator of sigma subunit)
MSMEIKTLGMNSISLKIVILYIFFAVLNISIFTIIIFENQVDLITEITKFRTKEIANNIYSRVTDIVEKINKDPKKYDQTSIVINELDTYLKSLINEYIVFKEDRSVLIQSQQKIELKEEYLLDAFRAYKNRDFTGQLFLTQVDEKKHEILFYFPLQIIRIDNAMLLFKLQMKEINNRIYALYNIVLIVICFIACFHILFGLFLNRLIVSPIKELSRTSLEISGGDLSARVKTGKKDEIGKLGVAFNTMAATIQEKIRLLDEQNKRMHMELVMARQVQKSIYPHIKENERFKFAVYHNPLIEVSGDYHDIFALGDGRFGCLIADVSGHGVSAALITMLIKELFEKAAPKFLDTKLLFRFINDEFGNLMALFEKFFTAFYLVIDNKRVVTYSNAAHPKALVLRPSLSKIFELDTNGVIIGMSKQLSSQFTSKSIKLQKNDKIILTTDGISEAVNPERKEYGSKQFLKVVKTYSKLSCEEMLEKILEDFNSFKGDMQRRDDETIIILEVK